MDLKKNGKNKESNNKSDIKELQKQYEERANNPEEGDDDMSEEEEEEDEE